MVAFTVAVVAGPGFEIFVETLVPEAHFIAERVAPGHHPSRGLGAALPIIHVVLLERARRAEAPHSGQPERLLDLRRGRLVDVNPRPHLGLVRPARVPNSKSARGSSEHREVREHRTDDRLYSAQTRTEALCHLRSNLFLIGQDLGNGWVGDRVGADPDDRMAIAGRHHYP